MNIKKNETMTLNSLRTSSGGYLKIKWKIIIAIALIVQLVAIGVPLLNDYYSQQAAQEPDTSQSESMKHYLDMINK
jgi:hypothetical protein